MDLRENHKSVVDVAGGGGGEGEDMAGGERVVDEAGFDELGMKLLEV